ncbi:MAG TPA: YccF domain-containing protein [Acidimicrobiales bacterium]|nr:YccF domain-containing protein [Acidimicrobiales bacterium]
MSIMETDGVRTLLYLLWLVFSRIWLAFGYAIAGICMFLLVITVPFGFVSFGLAACVLWPFGRKVVKRPSAGAMSTMENILWFVLAGLWMATAHLFIGVLLCLTIVGIPLVLGNFKLASVAIAPLGKEIVSTRDPRAAIDTISF